MNVEMSRMNVHVGVSGVLDGSQAMQLVNGLDRFRTVAVIVDFTGVRQFEAFGVDLLVKMLGRPRPGGAGIRCTGLPPCVAERLREQEIEIVESPRPPRWAPWAP